MGDGALAGVTVTVAEAVRWYISSAHPCMYVPNVCNSMHQPCLKQGFGCGLGGQRLPAWTSFFFLDRVGPKQQQHQSINQPTGRASSQPDSALRRP